MLEFPLEKLMGWKEHKILPSLKNLTTANIHNTITLSDILKVQGGGSPLSKRQNNLTTCKTYFNCRISDSHRSSFTEKLLHSVFNDLCLEMKLKNWQKWGWTCDKINFCSCTSEWSQFLQLRKREVISEKVGSEFQKRKESCACVLDTTPNQYVPNIEI